MYSPLHCYLFRLRLRYPDRLPFLEHTQPIFFLYCEIPSFTPEHCLKIRELFKLYCSDDVNNHCFSPSFTGMIKSRTLSGRVVLLN